MHRLLFRRPIGRTIYDEDDLEDKLLSVAIISGLSAAVGAFVLMKETLLSVGHPRCMKRIGWAHLYTLKEGAKVEVLLPK